MRALIAGLWLASWLSAGTAFAQLAPFNEVGVTMGHWHIASRDIQANKKIFVGMGGTPIPGPTRPSCSPAFVSIRLWGMSQGLGARSDPW